MGHASASITLQHYYTFSTYGKHHLRNNALTLSGPACHRFKENVDSYVNLGVQK